MRPIITCLWFDREAEEAAAFYTELFGGTVGRITRSTGAREPQGQVLTVDFRILDREFTALNGGPKFTFTEAISLVVPCDAQAEVDRLWTALTADGGRPGPCGWLTDRYGLSWQIVPAVLFDLLAGPDRAAADRVGRVVLASSKLDTDALTRAAAGEATSTPT